MSQALAEAREEPASMYPAVPATPEAFFQRCQRLRPAFFAEVFRRFTGALLGAARHMQKDHAEGQA